MCPQTAKVKLTVWLANLAPDYPNLCPALLGVAPVDVGDPLAEVEAEWRSTGLAETPEGLSVVCLEGGDGELGSSGRVNTLDLDKAHARLGVPL